MPKRPTFTEAGLPTAILKRDLLAGMADKRLQAEHDPAAMGDQLLAVNRVCEALDFFERAPSATDRIDKVKARAVSDGDFFLLARVARTYPHRVAAEDWMATGDAAVAADKLCYAVKAFERAGDGAASKLDAAKKKREELLPSGEIKMAAGAIADQVVSDVDD